MKKTIAVLLIFFFIREAYGENRAASTLPNPPKVKPVPEREEIRPERDIPPDCDRINWKVTGTKDGVTFAKDSAPIYSFDENGFAISAGNIPIGTEVKIVGFRVFGRKIYYALAAENQGSSTGSSGKASARESASSTLTSGKANLVKWIPGVHLEASGYKPDGQ